MGFADELKIHMVPNGGVAEADLTAALAAPPKAPGAGASPNKASVSPPKRCPPPSAGGTRSGGPSSSAWLRDALWEGVVERAGGAMLEMQGFPGDHAAVRARRVAHVLRRVSN